MTKDDFKEWKKQHVFLIKDFNDYIKLFNNEYVLETMTEKDLDDRLAEFTKVYEEERNNQLQYLSDKYHITKEVAYEIFPVYNALCELHNGDEPPKNALKPAINDAYCKLGINIRLK